MSLKNKLHQDMISAMKEKNSERVEILKIAISSIKNVEIEKGEELDEKLEEDIVRKETKKLKDAYEQYIKGGREDLAEKEKKQLEILEEYLPKLMNEEEIKKIVIQKKEELGIETLRDMGRLMGESMKELKGKADGTIVKKIVEEILNEN